MPMRPQSKATHRKCCFASLMPPPAPPLFFYTLDGTYKCTSTTTTSTQNFSSRLAEIFSVTSANTHTALLLSSSSSSHASRSLHLFPRFYSDEVKQQTLSVVTSGSEIGRKGSMPARVQCPATPVGVRRVRLAGNDHGRHVPACLPAHCFCAGRKCRCIEMCFRPAAGVTNSTALLDTVSARTHLT